MPALFSSVRSSVLYWLAWLLLALLFAALVNSASDAPWPNSILFALPTSLVFAFAGGFSSYYLCRTYPLAANLFLRIHRSYLLNLSRLARIEQVAKDSHNAILQDGSRLPISRSGYQKLKNLS